MKRLVMFLCGLICCIELSARPIEVGVTSWIGVAPLSVAEAKGFWKSQGVEVKIRKYALYEQLFRDYKARKIDVMYDMTGTWVDLYEQGYPITILAETDWSNGSDKIILKNNVQSVQQLKGRTIGTYLNKSSVNYFLDTYLRRNGLKLSDLKREEQDGEVLAKAFIADQFPLVVLYDPPALMARNQGAGRVVADTGDYPGIMPEGFAIHPDSLAQIGQDQLVKFFVGWLEARQWLSQTNDWPSLEKILDSKTFAGEKKYASLDLIGMLNSVKFHSRTRLIERNSPAGGMAQYLSGIEKFLKENNQLPKPLMINRLVDTTAVLMAAKQFSETASQY